MSKTTKTVRYGVGNSENYSEERPYVDNIRTPQEAVAELKELQERYPRTKFRIFKQERTDVNSDVTDELV